MIKINIDVFEYTDADWDKIERVVETTGLITRSIRGRVRTSQLSLRERLTMVAIKRIALIALLRSPSQRVRIRQLEALGHSAPRFYEKLVAALSTDFSFPGGGTRYEKRRLHPGVDDDFLDDAHSLLLERLRENVERALAALRRPTNKNASKHDRDLLWHEALDIWCKLGGEPTGHNAADFLIAVSAPVFHAMQPKSKSKKKGLMPNNRAAVMAWLRRREKARQATAPAH